MISIDIYIIYIYIYILPKTNTSPLKTRWWPRETIQLTFWALGLYFPDILVSAYSSQGFGTKFSGKFNHSSHNGRKWTVIRIIWIGYDWISNMVWMIWYDIIWCDMILMWHDTMIWYNIQEYPIYEHNDSISDSHESLGGFPQVLVAPVTHWKVAS